MTTKHITRRSALKLGAAGLAAPFVYRAHAATAAPSETILHVSVGAGGMAASDIGSLTSSKHLKLVAVADVDAIRAAEMKKKHPDIKVYSDWREMFDKEKFDSVNVSTPDHMHAVPTMRAIRSGKQVYTQKPLTQTIYEARKLTEAAKDKKTVSQMGIQIHSSTEHRSVVATIHSGAIGKVKAVHSWSGKDWGDASPKPDRKDPVPPNLNWDLWLGVAADRPFIGGGYYHPGNWRKRLDFGTGTFGDMGCHILDPVFGSLGVGNPKSIKSVGDAPNAYNWGLHCEVEFVFPGTQYTTDTVALTWYNGNRRPPADVAALIKPHSVPGQGSIYIGTDGVMFSPYIGMPELMGAATGKKVETVQGDNHYHQWVDAARGAGKATAPFEYAGPLTEMVLLGCLSTRFPKTALEWDTAKMKVTNHEEANQYVRRTYRKGWEEEGF
ncbi:Gfo/Idh/MocA family protein [Fimbriiglobus ruber]|uniref:Oxidoreductase domain protein n=1 Tax=Fimbriiglobus ruber TaxID=1908690 RepID=A0A225DD09_9BACT|nr:Gfo/Idh/MocA family oxidoreductase [Fimbriiglobus ruber]OWK35039.1 oxidoreductase domain protein [Fimbriiglobus ruber]